ncbi:indolepyruvate oxidoreductase subunit beta [Candidatus Bipolaricaulota bacterium]
MTRNVILAGVGGQGLLSIAAVLGAAARAEGLQLKQAEVHGMAQRGGVVQSHVRYGDATIHSDLIREGTANLILSLEPMEALRYLPFLAPTGTVVTSRAPLRNIPDYPNIPDLLGEIGALSAHRLIDAETLAKEAGTARCANMVILGAGAPFLAISEDALIAGIECVFADKGPSIVATNVRGFRLGLKASLQDGSA